MRIIDDLLSTLDFEVPVRDIRQGLYWTAVLTRSCGLALSAAAPYDHRGGWPVRDAGHLTDRSARELAQLAHSPSLPEAAIGMATINSLLEIDEARCTEVNAAELLVQQGAGRRVALVGHFPFVEKLREAAGELWVIEKRQQEGDVPEGEAERLIPDADVVAITGSAFVNHTIEGLLALCRPEAYVVVLGPTTPLSPVLFKYGVDVIAGTKVIEAQTVLRYVSQGAVFRQMEGVRLLAMTKA
jgi:uncharacterized protein (DUF4213/DUF364 family)